MQRQADLLLAGGLFRGKLLRGQCLQCVLQITDLDFRFPAEPCPLLAVLLSGERIGLAVQRNIYAGHIIKVAGEDLLMPQVIVAGSHERAIAAAEDLVNDFGIAHTRIGGNVQGFLILRVRGSFLLRGISADMQHKGIGGSVVRVVHADAQLGIVQPVGGQFFLRGLVGHIVGEFQIAQDADIGVDPAGIQRLSVRGKVDVIGADTLAVFVINHAVVLASRKADLADLIEIRHIVVGDQVFQLYIVCVQRIAGGEIHIAVPNVHVALGIHRAVISQLHCVGLIIRSQGDGAGRLIQAIPAEIFGIFNGERCAQRAKRLQKCDHGTVADGKFCIVIVLPTVIAAVEAPCCSVLLPAQCRHFCRFNG